MLWSKMLERKPGHLRKCTACVVLGHLSAPGGNEIGIAHGLCIFVGLFRDLVNNLYMLRIKGP